MQNKFYQDFAAWLDRWLQNNVGDNPAKLRSRIPHDLMKGTLLRITIARVFHYINCQCRYKPETWGNIPPQQKTADVFSCDRHTIANAVKNV